MKTQRLFSTLALTVFVGVLGATAAAQTAPAAPKDPVPMPRMDKSKGMEPSVAAGNLTAQEIDRLKARSGHMATADNKAAMKQAKAAHPSKKAKHARKHKKHSKKTVPATAQTQ